MSQRIERTRIVQAPAPGGAADDWPSWTDDDRWAIGPDPADAEWASENLNDGGDGDSDGMPVPDDPIWDRWAEEAKQRQTYEELGVWY